MIAASNLELCKSRSPSSAAATDSSSRHLEFFARLNQPRDPSSSTSSVNTEDHERDGTIFSVSRMMPGVEFCYHRRGTADQHVACLPATSTLETRPGRLPNEILQRIFPLQQSSVLDLVLTRCNGDLVKAIEQLLAVQDTLHVHHGRHLYNLHSSSYPQQNFRHNQQLSNAVAGSYDEVPPNGSDGGAAELAVGHDGLLGRFPTHTTLAQSTPLPLHSAFSRRAAAFTTVNLLAPTPPPHAAGVPPATPRTLSALPLLDDWKPLFSVGARYPPPSTMIPLLFGHHQPAGVYCQRRSINYETPAPLPAIFPVLHTSLAAEHYLHGIKIAAAAAGHVTASRAMANVAEVMHGSGRVLESSSASEEQGSMTSN